MSIWVMLAVVAATPAAGASTEADLPIAGVWKAVPTPGTMGPDYLTITKRSIRFGRDSEALTSWKNEKGTIHLSTPWLTYTFRQESADRICLMSSLRTAAQPTAATPMPLRCFVRDKAASK